MNTKRYYEVSCVGVEGQTFTLTVAACSEDEAKERARDKADETINILDVSEVDCCGFRV